MKEDFHSFVESLLDSIKDGKSTIDIKTRDTDKTELTETSAPANEPSLTENRYLGLDQLNRLAKIYKEYNDEMWSEVFTHKNFLESSKGLTRAESLSDELKNALDILVGSDRSKRQSVLEGLNNAYKSWRNRVIEKVTHFIEPGRINCEEPFFFNGVKTGEEEVFKNPVSSFEIQLGPNFEPKLLVNGSVAQIKPEKLADAYDGTAGRIVYFGFLFTELKEWWHESEIQHIKAFWRKPWYDLNQVTYKIEFPEKEVFGHLVDSAVYDNRNSLEWSLKHHLKYFYRGTHVQEIDGSNLVNWIPEKSTFSGRHTVEVTYKDGVISASYLNRPIIIPLKEIVEKRKQIGQQADRGKKGEAALSLNYVYELITTGQGIELFSSIEKAVASAETLRPLTWLEKLRKMIG